MLKKDLKLNSLEEVFKIAAQMIGQRLITKQTGQNGRLCQKVSFIQSPFVDFDFRKAVFSKRALSVHHIGYENQGNGFNWK